MSGLTIKIVDPDDDYLGIEIHASNDRFAGSAQIYAGLTNLSEFAGQIAGFPADVRDERTYELAVVKRVSPVDIAVCVFTASTNLGMRPSNSRSKMPTDGTTRERRN